nr:hypothetical protein [Tanacetum cinerariifolium]
MATPDLNGTHTIPCLSNLHPAEPITNDTIKIEINKELLIELRNNAYNGAEANDTVDHITRFLEIINLVRIPNATLKNYASLCFHTLSSEKHEKGYDNTTLIDDEESSDDESDQDTNKFFDPYLSATDEGYKGHHMKCNDNTSESENFVQHDALHFGNINQQNEGICRVDKFEVIKYSIRNNEKFMGIHTLERDSWAQTVNGISNIYHDIF